VRLFGPRLSGSALFVSFRNCSCLSFIKLSSLPSCIILSICVWKMTSSNLPHWMSLCTMVFSFQADTSPGCSNLLALLLVLWTRLVWGCVFFLSSSRATPASPLTISYFLLWSVFRPILDYAGLLEYLCLLNLCSLLSLRELGYLFRPYPVYGRYKTLVTSFSLVSATRRNTSCLGLIHSSSIFYRIESWFGSLD